VTFLYIGFGALLLVIIAVVALVMAASSRSSRAEALVEEMLRKRQ
jgi:hypothetical protein